PRAAAPPAAPDRRRRRPGLAAPARHRHLDRRDREELRLERRDRRPPAASLGCERVAERRSESRPSGEGADARAAGTRPPRGGAGVTRASNWATFVRLLRFLRPYRRSLGVSTVL